MEPILKLIDGTCPQLDYRRLRFAETKPHLLREINNLLKINKVVQNYSKADGEDHLQSSSLPAVRCNALHLLELVLVVWRRDESRLYGLLRGKFFPNHLFQ